MEIIKRIRKKLGEKKGSTLFSSVIILWVGMFLICVVSIFIYLYSMMMGISDYTQQAILQTAASNAYNAYNGVREGNSSAHIYAGSGSWNEMVTTAEVMRRLEDMLGLKRSGSSLVQYTDEGNMKYGISDIHIHCSNVEVGYGGTDVKLTFQTTVTAEIPVTFLGATIHIKKPITLTSYYTPRF